MAWLQPEKETDSRTFLFLNFLSVLSALHVAGMRHVYVHGQVAPKGEWWEALQGENVTFVYTGSAARVFQQEVRILPHRSDVDR